MLSWIVFWMEKSDIGNRMALGITTILTIMFLLGSLNGNLPKVSYPKALDWYLLVSFSFVFLSLIECLVVYVLLKQTRKHDQDITRGVRMNCCYIKVFSQEPMTWSVKLPHIPDTAFSQNDLFLV